MKTIFRFLPFLLLCVAYTQSKAQSEPYVTVQVNTLPSTYTVVTDNDTIYAREASISFNDTIINLQSMVVTLSEYTEGEWHTVQTGTIHGYDVQLSPCNQVLCCYKKVQNTLVIYVGSYSLYSKHSINIQVQMTGGGTLHYNLSQEF